MTASKLMSALGGISGVHVTPYDVDGKVNAALLARIVDRIAAAGVHAVVSAGNTGGHYALSDDEVPAVHDAAIAANAGRAVLIASVGRSLVDAIPMARRARAAGADAILVHQPLDPFAAPQAQAGYFQAIADTSEIPVLAYLRSDGRRISGQGAGSPHLRKSPPVLPSVQVSLVDRMLGQAVVNDPSWPFSDGQVLAIAKQKPTV
jgi:4-hydroxy-tetrahydrodipicolinate synthase